MTGLPPKSCKVAIVGAGYIAAEHARAFGDVPGVTLVGIHSRTRAKAEAVASEHGIARVCSSVADLYESTRADLVIVAVSELSTNAVSRACFEFPWTVMLEKPPGYSLREAKEIRLAAADRRVLVALNRRFYSTTRAALTQVSEEPGFRYVRVADQENQSKGLASGKPQQVVRNWMFANSIHVIDYLRLFGRGRVVSVDPVMAWNAEAPDVVIARVMFETGDAGLYEGIWHAPGPWGVAVTVRGHRWEMRPLERLRAQVDGGPQVEIGPHEWDQRFKPGFRAQAAEAVAAALGGQSRAATLDEAVETMELVAAIFGGDEW